MDYGNGVYVEYTYDKLDRVVGVCYNGVQRATYTYAPNGDVSMVTDHTNGMSYLYYYSSNGELTSVRVSDTSGELKYISRYTYDEFGKLTNKNIYFTTDIQTNALAYNVTYNYDSDGNIVSVINGPGTESYTYDNLGRLSTNKFGSILTDAYTYLAGSSSDYTTGLVGSISTTIGSSTITVSYAYDERGNIIQETRSPGGTISYTYDDLDQLIRENNSITEETYVYTYDKGGNILTKNVYNYTTGSILGTALESYNYSYGNSNWKDQLTSINGTTITYDAIGNPLSYYNGSSYSFTWQNGRELASAVKGSNSVSYKYNTEGIRVSKIVNGILHEYTLDGTKIVREVIFTGNTSSSAVDEDLRYFYDANGYLSVIDRLQYDGASTFTRTYYFAKTNLQGDVTALYSYSTTSSDYSLVAIYNYDAWGNVEEATAYNGSDIATLNPFRYRSYYYDTETELYYLNTRYYDPQVGRFINEDDVSYLGANGDLEAYNLYAYCSNNPVMGYDPMGTWNWRNFWDVVVTTASVVAGVAVGIVTGVAVTANTGNPVLGVCAGIGAGTATTGAINNAVNAIYYEFSNGESDLTSGSYRDGYVNRWDRLDYTKSKTKEEHYSPTAWRYYSEYNVHMYGWYLTRSFYTGKEGDGFLSDFAYSCYDANVVVGEWDERGKVNVATVVVGVLGF